MTRIQKLLLVSSGICFCLTLYAFLFLDFWILIACFILHSILLIGFSYFCFRTQEDRTPETIRLREELEQSRLTRQAAVSNLEEQLRLKDKALEASAQELEKTKDELSSLNDQLSNEIEKVKTLEENAEKAESAKETIISISSILPDLSASKTASAIDIAEVAKEAANEFKKAAAEAGLSIRVASPENPLLVKADSQMLRTLFRNIIDNSIKYMKRHGSLVITMSNIGDELFIVLKDNGEGLAEDETKRIFELNYQGSNRISGNGLGLFQAKAIVEYYGGTIYAKSTPGKGMGIFVELPSAA